MAKSNALETHKQIERMIGALLRLGRVTIIHDDGRISWTHSPTETLTIPVKGKEPMTLCTYKVDCKLHNAIMVNPLNESVGTMSSEKLWFYQITGMTYSRVAASVIYKLLETAVAAYKDNMKITDPIFIHALQSVIGFIDDKTDKEIKLIMNNTRDYSDVLDEQLLKEFDLIRKVNILDLMSITYDRKSRTTRLRTCFGDPEEKFKKQFGKKIRKKTWEMLETLFKEIYATEDLTKPIFEVQAQDLKCPQFKTYLEVLVKSWSFLMPFLSHIYDDETAEDMNNDIVFLESCVPNIDKFATVGMWTNTTTFKPIDLGDGTTTEDVRTQTEERPSRSRVDASVRRDTVKDDPTPVSEPKDPHTARNEANQTVGLAEEAHRRSRDELFRRDEDDRYRRYSDRVFDRYDRDRYRDRYDRRDDRYDRYPRDRYERDDYDRRDRGRVSLLESAAMTEDRRRRTYYRSGYGRSRGDYWDSIT